MPPNDDQVDATTLEKPADAPVETTPAGETTQPLAPEPSASTLKIDWNSDDNPWKATAKKNAGDAQSARGQLRKQAENDALLLGVTEELKTYREHFTSAYADPDELKAKLAALDAKGTEARLASRDKVIATQYFNGIGKDLEALQKAGVEIDDKRLTPAVELWAEGGTHESPTDMAKLYEAREMVKELRHTVELAVKDKKTEAAEKKAQEYEAKFKIDGGLMENANPRGMPAGSLDVATYAAQLKKGERLPTPEEIDRMTAAYTRRS